MWKEKQIFAVGGLSEIGFYNNSDFLMVLSSAGRGIYDCLNLIRIERDYSDYYYESWNSLTGIVKGIGFLDGEDIICGGFEAKDPLNKITLDGWGLKIEKEIKKN